MQLKFDHIPTIKGHCENKKKILDTHIDTMLVATPSIQNLQNNAKTPLGSGSVAILGRGDVIGNP